jgi:pimeloyl-ACP methyl ester carboxylesterase
MQPFIETLVINNDHRISHQHGKGSRLIICLSGVGTKRQEMPPFEFSGSASDHGRNHLLMIAEKRRSWMNDPAFTRRIVQEAERIIARFAITEVVTLGNSMGGFMALVLPQLMRVDRAIAFSPQFSMHPEHVPEETRWQHWRRNFPGYQFETIGTPDPAACDYYILHGAAPEEEIHWRRFPKDPALHHFILRGCGHNLVAGLKQKRLLPRVVRLAAAGKPRKLRLLLEEHYSLSRRVHSAPQIPA